MKYSHGYVFHNEFYPFELLEEHDSSHLADPYFHVTLLLSTFACYSLFPWCCISSIMRFCTQLQHNETLIIFRFTKGVAVC